jgi:tRNA A37 threonylcarbamoyladenosine dehydratase
MLFTDPDRVEPKNNGRQLFALAEAGQPKAEVLASRLNAAFGPSLGGAVGASVRFIDVLDTFQHTERHALNIVVGAVDNSAARAIPCLSRPAGQTEIRKNGNVPLRVPNSPPPVSRV